jgi:hypothetical protein
VNSLSFRLLAQVFQKQTGTQFTIVPYRAANSLREDFVAGRIELLVGLPTGITLFPEASTRAYAVAADARLAFAPAIPTFAEAGLPSLVFSFWYGLFAPKGTPEDSIAKVNAAAVEALADRVIHKRLIAGLMFFPRKSKTRPLWPPCRRPMLRNGGRSSRRPASRASDGHRRVSSKHHGLHGAGAEQVKELLSGVICSRGTGVTMRSCRH